MPQTKYLTPEDPGAFEGLTVKPVPQDGYPFSPGDATLCPRCKGHGGWNLELNAYGPGKHFKCFCSQCNGWGHVKKDSKDAICIHTTRELSQEECREKNISHMGKCWHVYECTKCGHTHAEDSSD